MKILIMENWALRSVKIYSGTISVVLFLFTFPAIADDIKLYTGNICKPEVSNINYFSDHLGSLSNREKIDVKFHCPVIKDRMSGRDNLRYANVYATNNHPTKNISCIAYNLDNSGNKLTSKEFVSSFGVGYKAIGTGFLDTKANTSLHIRCTLPAMYEGNASMIHSVVVREDT